MRNSILGVMCEIVIRVLSKDGLDPQQRRTRDQYLDRLEVSAVLVLISNKMFGGLNDVKVLTIILSAVTEMCSLKACVFVLGASV